MRVSISGSHSTGKTLLTERVYAALSARYPGRVTVIEEVARRVISKGFNLNRDAGVESYLHYILEQLHAERQATFQHVISDRSLVDLLAYMRTNADPRIPTCLLQMVEELVWLEAGFFDLYCYLPLEFPLVADQVRPADEEYRASVDSAVRQIFCEYDLEVVTVLGSIDERCEKVVALFGSTGKRSGT